MSQFKNTNWWSLSFDNVFLAGQNPLFSSWYIRIACMFTRLKSRDRDRDYIPASFIPNTLCVFPPWHCEHVGEVVPSGEYVRNTFWYNEYANKASQWLVCLCSRSRSGQLALQAAGQCTGPCTLTVMPLMTNRVKQSHRACRPTFCLWKRDVWTVGLITDYGFK